MSNQLLRTVLLSVLLSEAHLVAGAGAEFHLSPDGNDASAGTAAAPFRTLNGARDAIRTMRNSDGHLSGGVDVVVHGGTYWLPEPFDLGPQDGGTAASPVVYRAAEGEAAWLSGGMPLRFAEFSPVTDQAILKRLPEERGGPVLAYRLTAEQTSRFAPRWPDTWWTERNLNACNELFADGRRLPLARWPNRDYTTFGEIVEPADEPDETPEFKYAGRASRALERGPRRLALRLLATRLPGGVRPREGRQRPGKDDPACRPQQPGKSGGRRGLTATSRSTCWKSWTSRANGSWTAKAARSISSRRKDCTTTI